MAGLHQNGFTRITLLGDTIEKEAPMSILVLLIVLILVFGVGGGVYNKGVYRNYGYGGGGVAAHHSHHSARQRVRSRLNKSAWQITPRCGCASASADEAFVGVRSARCAYYKNAARDRYLQQQYPSAAIPCRRLT
jgi:hypothetical protein